MASRLKEASRLLAECRKYREKSWIAGEDELRMKSIIRQLQIILQPQCTREDWLELYKVSSVGKIIGPFDSGLTLHKEVIGSSRTMIL